MNDEQTTEAQLAQDHLLTARIALIDAEDHLVRTDDQDALRTVRQAWAALSMLGDRLTSRGAPWGPRCDTSQH